MSEQCRQRDVAAARQIARLWARCACLQGWHGHHPKKCDRVPSKFGLELQAKAPSLKTDGDRGERVKPLVVCEACAREHSAPGGEWFDIHELGASAKEQ